MTYKTFALFVLAVSSLSQPAMADTYWSTFDGTFIGTIDTSTGVATVVGNTGQAGTYGLAEDPTTHILYVSYGSSIATANKTTGALTSIGNTGYSIYGITFDASGQMWAAAAGGTAIYKINKATAAATLVGATPGASWMDLGFYGSTLYAVSGSGTTQLYTINTTTGVGNPPLPPLREPAST